MSFLSLHLHWENLRQRYLRRKTTIYDLSKMMARNVKLYTIIDQFMKIFKLIKRIEVSAFILLLVIGSNILFNITGCLKN